jgi:hypothetical protein
MAPRAGTTGETAAVAAAASAPVQGQFRAREGQELEIT